MKELIVKRLEQRGVSIREIADLVYKLQSPYDDTITMDKCIDSVDQVLNKREVQYTLLTGIALDKLTEQGAVEEPLASIIERDEPLYGVDESLALAIANIYGTIGFTSFGYLDKNKIGVMKKLDTIKGEQVNTFIDDLVAGIAAAAAARIAHQKRSEEEAEEELTQKEVS
ncbi:phosphatidylglycerophosphatase A [Natroniella sulfidigena]|uniref:phosphatidylglycerophosphatase A family protein n=1 Tax=Natroniella sulfidigena TaxID=723921 RepID=UPI00200A02DF|nr:phosphatidylglycerophosphatase A [Natroniella sulfidigena]MCK8815749.1 phosphatidylglycerophosphatase A [Natroniella sulfidigena]